LLPGVTNLLENDDRRVSALRSLTLLLLILLLLILVSLVALDWSAYLDMGDCRPYLRKEEEKLLILLREKSRVESIRGRDIYF
jgi:hypothetical protein